MSECTIEQGWNLDQAGRIAELYEIAFGSKFAKAIGNKELRVDVISRSLVPEFSYVAVVDDSVVGIAGFQTDKGSLTGGLDLEGLIKSLGFFRGIWAGLIFSLFERTPKENELVMDGIVVDATQRGFGLGSKLLDQIIDHAKNNNYETVRLDVIDSNPRAKKLYESKGFSATQTEHFPYLKWLIGFSGSTTMVYTIQNA